VGKRVVYVGGLTKSVSDNGLHDLFNKYGTVARAYIVRHKNTDISAGYGFVKMASTEQALKVIVALEGALLDGRCLGSTSHPTRPTPLDAEPHHQ
jgi:RNA recognition motif-containing protein